jgi:hypothetical protein
MSRRTLELVQKSLPHLCLCKNKLVLPPTAHVVRGFVFERTPYKETFYLWRLVAPLFHITLDYSTRIPRGEHVHLSRESPHEPAAVIAKIVSENLSYLETVQTPRDFLDHISWMIGNDSPKFLFDLAMTYFMVGRYHECFLALREASEEAERAISGYKRTSDFDGPVISRMREIRRMVDDFAAALRSRPAAAAEILADRERRNVAHYGLTETMLKPPQI